MATTYDDTLPTDKDMVRTLLGDTDMTDALITDEHIQAVLGTKLGNVRLATAALADELVARYARDPIRWTAEGVQIDMSARLTAWQNIAMVNRSNDSPVTFVPATYGEADALDEYGRTKRFDPAYPIGIVR